jgi:hypothetical protein
MRVVPTTAGAAKNNSENENQEYSQASFDKYSSQNSCSMRDQIASNQITLEEQKS